MNGIAYRMKGAMGNRLVIVIFALLILGGVFTAGIVWSSLDHVEQRRSYRAAIDQAARLSSENSRLEQENEELRKRIVTFERQIQVNQIAYDKLTTQLSESSSYINSLREDLDFYQSIISPHDNQAGVKIQGWRVRSGETGSDYRYQLTVVQSVNHDNSVTGKASVHIEGTRQGTVVRLPMADMGEPPGDLSFKYFQILDGRFSLPAGFQPTAAVVTVVSGSSDTQVERRFEWTVEGQG